MGKTIFSWKTLEKPSENKKLLARNLKKKDGLVKDLEGEEKVFNFCKMKNNLFC